MKTLLTSISLAILLLFSTEAKFQTLERTANGAVQPPISSENIGTFNSVAYVRHQGQFVGVTQGGRFVVPYEVTVPFNPSEGNGIVLFEPPHIDAGPVAREVYLGPRFVFSSGFSHASVGYSNLSQRLLNSNSSFTPVIKGTPVTTARDSAEEVTDTEILQQFVLALNETRLPFPAQVERIYAIGVSDSGNVLHQMYEPFGHKFFDLSLVCTRFDFEPAEIRGQNPIIILNTEADGDVRSFASSDSSQYRWYAVAGGPHILDDAATPETSAESREYLVAGTTPINWLPFIRALLVTSMRN